MIRRTVKSIVKWAMDDPQHLNYNKQHYNTIGNMEASSSQLEEDRSIRRPGMLFTVYPAEGGTVIQCKSNNHGEVTKNSSNHPRLYVIHDNATFNDELANIIHIERIRML